MLVGNSGVNQHQYPASDPVGAGGFRRTKPAGASCTPADFGLHDYGQVKVNELAEKTTGQAIICVHSSKAVLRLYSALSKSLARQKDAVPVPRTLFAPVRISDTFLPHVQLGNEKAWHVLPRLVHSIPEAGTVTSASPAGTPSLPDRKRFNPMDIAWPEREPPPEPFELGDNGG